MIKVTEKQKEEYIKCGGLRCPRCGSEELTGSSWNTDQGIASQDMFCNECELDWTDEYTLDGIRVLGE